MAVSTSGQTESPAWFDLVNAAASDLAPKPGSSPVLTLPHPHFNTAEETLYESLLSDGQQAFRRLRGCWEAYPWPLVVYVNDPSHSSHDRSTAWWMLSRRSEPIIRIHRMDWNRAKDELEIRSILHGSTLYAEYRDEIAACGTITILEQPRLSGVGLFEEIRRQIKRDLGANRSKQHGLEISFSELASQLSRDLKDDSDPVANFLESPYTIEYELALAQIESREIEELLLRRKLEVEWDRFLCQRLNKTALDAFQTARSRSTVMTPNDRKRLERARKKLRAEVASDPKYLQGHYDLIDVTFYLGPAPLK